MSKNISAYDSNLVDLDQTKCQKFPLNEINWLL